MTRVLLDHDFHPPDDVRVFRVPRQGLLVDRPDRLVYEVAVHDAGFRGEVVLRHYAFADRWFKVNVCLDLDGHLFDEDALPYPFCFNCDVSTPMQRSGDSIFAVDLWLDVLVRADGQTYTVGDEDEFADALRAGLLSEREAEGARLGLGELVDLASSGKLIGFLEEIVPFGPCAKRPAHGAPQRLRTADVPEIWPGSRTTW